ncbi:hypothetical protein NPIL_299181 [Nephila pilipes]|uniref:Uncharacterized protein n=1 Tax=Nephila pilipes TaxID=299642 RepID=A0A8X6T2J3_NEPPI|nr:hypothetical protein NPIL_299181 [Nephila pilipes]
MEQFNKWVIGKQRAPYHFPRGKFSKDDSRLIDACHVTFEEILRRRGLTTEEAVPLFESLCLDCSDTPVECSSDEEMPIDDPLVSS